MFKQMLMIFALSILTTVGIYTPNANAATKDYLDYSAQHTLSLFSQQIPGGSDLLAKGAGVLVFPSVIKAGIGWGGEYGEGALIEKGSAIPSSYYNIVGLSFGFQFGIQVKSVVIVFLTDKSLQDFKNSSGWKAGVDGSIAVIAVGVGASIDTQQLNSPIVAVVFDQRGLMYSLTLTGDKISRIYK